MRDAKGRFTKGPFPPGVVRDDKGRFKSHPRKKLHDILIDGLIDMNKSLNETLGAAHEEFDKQYGGIGDAPDRETDELEMLLHPLRYANGSRVEPRENKASTPLGEYSRYIDSITDIEHSGAVPSDLFHGGACKLPSLFQRIKRRLTGK